MNPAMLEAMRRLLDAPDPLDVMLSGRDKLGEWRHWTPERQLWYLRRVAGLTQVQLAARSGVSQHRISEIEAGGDWKLSTLTKLWGAMGWRPLVIPDFPIVARRSVD